MGLKVTVEDNIHNNWNHNLGNLYIECICLIDPQSEIEIGDDKEEGMTDPYGCEKLLLF